MLLSSIYCVIIVFESKSTCSTCILLCSSITFGFFGLGFAFALAFGSGLASGATDAGATGGAGGVVGGSFGSSSNSTVALSTETDIIFGLRVLGALGSLGSLDVFVALDLRFGFGSCSTLSGTASSITTSMGCSSIFVSIGYSSTTVSFTSTSFISI